MCLYTNLTDLLAIEVGQSDQCAHCVCCAFLLVPQFERMCASEYVCVRAHGRGMLAWRGGDIHTLDGNVKCVLHTCMTFEAASGIARQGVR